MKKIIEGFREVWQSDKVTFATMILSLLVGGLILLTALFNLSPARMTVNIGYGDIGGYREGGWYYLIAFAIIGVLIGVVQNIIAMWMFQEKGRGTAVVFLSAGLIVGAAAFFTLLDLIGGNI